MYEFYDAFWQALIGAGASLGAAGIAANSREEQQLKADELSEKQMAFQERMSSTAHQREVADLRAAGLNPILSAGGSGASTPGGSAGTAIDIVGDAALQGVSGAMQSLRLDAEMDNLREQNKNISQDTALKKEQEWNNMMQGRLAAQQMKKVAAEEEAVRANTDILREDLSTAKANAMRGESDQQMLSSKEGGLIRYLGAIMRELGLTGDGLSRLPRR